LADGSVVKTVATGGKIRGSGYDLTRLMVGARKALRMSSPPELTSVGCTLPELILSAMSARSDPLEAPAHP